MEQIAKRFDRRSLLRYAALGSLSLLAGDSKSVEIDHTPNKDITDLIQNPARFADQIIWTEGYVESHNAAYSGIIFRRTTPFSVAGRKVTINVVNNAYYLQDLYVNPDPKSPSFDTRKQKTGYGLELTSFLLKPTYVPQYEHVRVKGKIINQNVPQSPYYVLQVIKQEKIK